MSPIWTLTGAILAPTGAGLATLLLPRRALSLRVILALAGPIAAVVLLGLHIASEGVPSGAAPFALSWMPLVQLNLALNADKLGLFFALLVSGIGVLIALYARAYFGPDADSLYRFYPCLHLFMTAMLGVALADNFVLLLLFWELTSVSSFLLIGWERDDPTAVTKAMQAFVVTAAGGLCMMVGLIVLGITTGHWTFSALLADPQAVTATPALATSFALIFCGAAAKSAQWPLHFWLPGAMAAPTPVSAYLHSATMVKAGVYLTGRMWPILAVALPLWPKLIVPIAAVTMVYGAFVALQKTDLKQIFAYSTVSQLGLLMCMYGLGAFSFVQGGQNEPNVIWDVSQILNHALYKAPLFILAGAIGHVASRQLPDLKGLFYRGRTERIMTVVMVLAAYALAAGPLTVSFTAKEFFFYQIWNAYEQTRSPWFYGLIAAAVATGMFNVAIFLRLASTLLSRKPSAQHGHDEADPNSDHAQHGHDHHEHEKGLWPAFLWVPGAVIVAFQFVGGIVPGAFEALFGWLEPNLRFFHHFPMTWDAHWGVPLAMSLAAITLGVALGIAPLLRRVLVDPHDRIYPAFYKLCTVGGGRVFGILQTGHGRTYLALVFVAIVVVFVLSVRTNWSMLVTWPAEARLEAYMPGYLVALLVCLSAILMPVVNDRASRVLVLGACGFSVTAVYYLYQAPDLALTQISIEIVSLILFLLVLSQLPKHTDERNPMIVLRTIIAVSVGAIMFWLTLTSSLGLRPTMPYTRATDGRPLAHLGEFFLRNSEHAHDAEHWTSSAGTGVVARGQAPSGSGVKLHSGGGGKNVVNVILVDGRGFDTMGEITVLGLAALGVWTLLRRHKRTGTTSHNEPATKAGAASLALDIPDPVHPSEGHSGAMPSMLSGSSGP